MTNPALSNAVENKQVVLWQYDQAPNLLALIDGFNQIATDTVTQFWDYFRDRVFNIETADYFGLNVLGRLMGLPRPKVDIGESAPTEISDDFFRRLLRGRFFLFGMSPTVPNYNKYLAIIWGGSKAHVIDGGGNGNDTMAMSFTEPRGATAEELAMHEQHPDLIYIYPAGIRTNEPSASSMKVIGAAGQDLENFADAFSWVKRPTASGGIFAGNEKAKFLDGEKEEGGGGNG